MKKNVLIYGTISGLIVSVLMLLNMNYVSQCMGNGTDYSTGMILGYASMIIAFSIVFVGMRNFRDKYNDGAISFGKAFQVGILMSLITSTFYVVAWLIFYYNFVPDFMDNYVKHALDEMRACGATEAEISNESKEMAELAVNYKNPFVNAMYTYMEILPVGLIVTLISALILKKPANAQTQVA